jgi:hypothetical protein
MPQHVRRMILAALAATCCSSALAIEAPKTEAAKAAATKAEAPAAVAEVAPTLDDKNFYETLRRSSQRRAMSGLRIPDEVVLALARGDADIAVGMLAAAAAKGGNQENIALVRIQHWCNSVGNRQATDVQAQIDKLDVSLPVERRARAAGVLREEARFRDVAAEGCRKANFDYQGIEARLRAAADAGDPASATELSQFLRDPVRKQAMLKAAAAKNFAPAMHALAMQRLIAVQRNENTEDVASIRTMFKQAGRYMSKAKLELANCMAVGCDGYPPDAAAATSFGLDAARDGEPTAFISMIRLGWGARLSRVQLLGWQYFGDRLNEAGCMGDTYIPNLIAFNQTIKALEQGQDEKLAAAGRQQGEDFWRDYGMRAQKEQGCVAR